MVRSLWKAAVVVGLAWTGLAWAQTSSPTQPERYMTVREEGGAPQRCKLLKTWREPNGSAAYEVQAVQSGEVMTIIEAGQPATNPSGARSLATRIFHWGRGNRPPADAPTSPPGAQVFAAPVVSGIPPAPPSAWGKTPATTSRSTPVTNSVSPPRTAPSALSPSVPQINKPVINNRTISAPASVPDPLTPRNSSSSIVPPPTAQKTKPTSATSPTLVYQSSPADTLTPNSAESNHDADFHADHAADLQHNVPDRAFQAGHDGHPAATDHDQVFLSNVHSAADRRSGRQHRADHDDAAALDSHSERDVRL